jgi:hypothetical protein
LELGLEALPKKLQHYIENAAPDAGTPLGVNTGIFSFDMKSDTKSESKQNPDPYMRSDGINKANVEWNEAKLPDLWAKTTDRLWNSADPDDEHYGYEKVRFEISEGSQGRTVIGYIDVIDDDGNIVESVVVLVGVITPDFANGRADVTFVQYQPIQHAAPTDEYEYTFDRNTERLTFGLVITDNDGDVAKGRVILYVYDDIPVNELSGEEASATAQESLLPGGTGDDGSGALVTAVLDSATVKSLFTEDNFGSDGAAGSKAVVFGLHLVADGMESGLHTVNDSKDDFKGDPILLTQNPGTGTVTGSMGGVDYFTLEINSVTGEVTLTLLKNIWHDTPGDTREEMALLDGLKEVLFLDKAVTDADGDTVVASFDLSGVFRIEDDTPPDPTDITAWLNEARLTDETNPTDGTRPDSTKNS